MRTDIAAGKATTAEETAAGQYLQSVAAVLKGEKAAYDKQKKIYPAPLNNMDPN